MKRLAESLIEVQTPSILIAKRIRKNHKSKIEILDWGLAIDLLGYT